MFCEGEPYFKRGPSFTILLSLLTLGGNISVIPFIFIQVILCALTFKLIIDEIQKNNISFGVAAVFIETHQDPDNAPSDGPNMIPITELDTLLDKLVQIDKLIKN